MSIHAIVTGIQCTVREPGPFGVIDNEGFGGRFDPGDQLFCERKPESVGIT